MRQTSNRRRGIVLFVVLGVLLILSLLATVFATLQRTERHVSRNYLDTVRARLAAMSGVEHGAMELRRFSSTTFFSSPRAFRALRYFGRDDNEVEQDAVLMAAPLEKATNPSLAYENETIQNPEDANVIPRKIKVNGVEVGFTRYMESGTYGRNADHYALKVVDASGLIHVNDGLDESPTYGSVTANLKRILDRLGDIVGVAELGEKIVSNRGPGYRVKRELLRALSPAEYEKVALFVTAQTWVDPNVVQPVPLSNDEAVKELYAVDYHRGPSPGIYRYGRQKNRLAAPVSGALKFAPEAAAPGANEHAIWGLDELNPQWIEVCARAPININSAPKQVLQAILAKLQGFWVVERRRENPATQAAARLWQNIIHSQDASGDDGDEYGYLYTTDPIKDVQETGVNSPDWIAEEIIACRTGRTSSQAPFFDYAAAPFGGPFRSWRQFYDFCDNLVKIGCLKETRTGIYFNYLPSTQITGAGTPSDSHVTKIQIALASQAIADVLKANFNPNLHLNELNPDRNMFTHVDKTDLIVASTEFCFVPGGYFEIDSLGRILYPEGSGDALAAADNRLVAQAKMSATVKLYDTVRFSSQKDLYGTKENPHEISARVTLPQTNSGISLEIGPEVDSGIAPQENEWAGYIAFPTNGGLGPHEMGSSPQTPEQPGDERNQEVGSPHCTLHVHFRYDYRAHHHEDGTNEECAGTTQVNENTENSPDRTEAYPGPYHPLKGVTNKHRLARSFRAPVTGGTGSLPNFETPAPLDLRIDGAYVERDSSPAWLISREAFGGDIIGHKAMISYWIKPSFFPEMTGKPRAFFNMQRLDPRGDEFDFYSTANEPAPLTHFFAASQKPVTVSTPWAGYDVNFINTNPMSMCFLHAASFMTLPQNWGSSACLRECLGARTPTLNWHFSDQPEFAPPSAKGNPDALTYFMDNTLRAHQWVHVVCAWEVTPASAAFQTGDSSNPRVNPVRMWVNGRSTGVERRANVYYEMWPQIDWTRHFKEINTVCGGLYPLTGQPGSDACTAAMEPLYGDKNPIRLGEVNRISNVVARGQNPYRPTRNFASDSTIDEFYYFRAWETQTETVATNFWAQGRYHLPRTQSEGEYVSPKFGITVNGVSRTLPKDAGVSPPGPPPSPPSPGKTVTADPVTARLLGTSWTWFGELNENTPEYRPLLVDYSAAMQGQRAYLRPKLEISFEVDGTWLTPVTDEGYSALLDQAGNPVEVSDAKTLRWRARFGWETAIPVGAILLATPYLDDLTLYFDGGDTGLSSYYVN